MKREVAHRLLPPGDEPTSREMFTRTVNEGLLQLYGLVRLKPY